ncbi:MAG: divergent polysaccharide deacetylase family protein [Rickettsiales bacterium]|jgi:polysaccharide deacetylase 2 family uncharacterized protein YibQ|nr:divergent polysaccharide deacetylase family protein [Rickettsiales bacterium]
MKNNSGFVGFLRLVGVTPLAGMLFMMLILVSGITLGLLVRNASKRAAVKKRPPVSHEEKREEPGDIAPGKVKAPPPPQYGEGAPFMKYALAVEGAVSGPFVAVIIDDMGVDMLRSKMVLELPGPLTVSYLTYAPNLSSQVSMAAAGGKEVMLHVPMEALNDTYDYGPEYLSTAKSRADNQDLLKKMLARADGYVAVNNHMGSRFTGDYSQMAGVLEVLKAAGLGFVDSKTTAKSETEEIAGYLGVPYGARDVFLDDSGAEADIKESLAKLERIAARRGYAIAIGHPRDATIRALSAWLEELEDKGVTLVPVSYVLGRR